VNKYTMIATIVEATTEDVIQWAQHGHTGDVRAFVREALTPALDAMTAEGIRDNYAGYLPCGDETPVTRRAQLVRDHGGYYEMHPGATVEDWDDVLALPTVASTERIEDLTGWAPYTAAYRVVTELGDTCTYFVEEQAG